MKLFFMIPCMFRELDESITSVIYNLFNARKIKVAKCQLQEGAVDYGLFKPGARQPQAGARLVSYVH